jgi:8-oxo-dGTP diphosphatase
VLQRSQDDESHPGRVDFPGGGVEDSESYQEAIRREVSEESGIDVPLHDFVLTYTFTQYDTEANTIVTRFLYIAHTHKTDVRLSSEHDEYWWRRPSALEALFSATSWIEPLQFVSEHKLLTT